MGISRDSRHKHRKTGGRRNIHQKKRKFEMGRPPAMTKLCTGTSTKRVRLVRGRGGNMKFRALRLDVGNYAWPSQNCTRKARILDVVYNATSNELVRTKTLLKNTIVQIESSSFRTWYTGHYGKSPEDGKAPSDQGSKHVQCKKAARASTIEDKLREQFKSGRLLACISSRPGQTGRADGYIIEGEELAFYLKKLEKKKR